MVPRRGSAAEETGEAKRSSYAKGAGNADGGPGARAWTGDHAETMTKGEVRYMKRWMITCALVAILALAGGAPGHADEKHHGHDGRPADGHGAAIGKPGDPGRVSRAIEVKMSDAMHFKPDRIRVRRGETIRFVVHNVGNLEHEMVLGTMEELKEHAELMRKSPGMEHAEPNEVSVKPGKTGELIWQFTEAGTVHFGCLVPGHFEAGMKGEIAVGAPAK